MLNGTLISFFCAQVILASGAYAPACAKAAEAATVQSGLKLGLDGTEHYFQSELQNRLPLESKTYGALAVMVYKKTLKASFRVPFLKADLNIQGSEESGNAGLTWHF